MAFNLATIDTRAASEQGVWFTITDLDDAEIFEGDKPVQLLLAGKDSAVAQEVAREVMSTKDAAKTVAKLILGWSANLEAKSAEEIAAVPHVQDFILKKVRDRVNFTPKVSDS